ncbi:hypothetical protein DL95DRAFT_407844 [Leptodontidium sp. 2 PMI_412]|nr:hypothetical protein DL95DRAFT_407844 [Leptodontidium sp. 2 PMI_412]
MAEVDDYDFAQSSPAPTVVFYVKHFLYHDQIDISCSEYKHIRSGQINLKYRSQNLKSRNRSPIQPSIESIPHTVHHTHTATTGSADTATTRSADLLNNRLAICVDTASQRTFIFVMMRLKSRLSLCRLRIAGVAGQTNGQDPVCRVHGIDKEEGSM